MKRSSVVAICLLLSACFPSFETSKGTGGTTASTSDASSASATAVTASAATSTSSSSSGTGGGGGCGSDDVSFQTSIGQFGSPDGGSIQSIVVAQGKIIVGGYSGVGQFTNNAQVPSYTFFLSVLDDKNQDPAQTLLLPLPGSNGSVSNPIISLAIQDSGGSPTLLVATSGDGRIELDRYALPLDVMSAPTTILSCSEPSLGAARIASNGSQAIFSAAMMTSDLLPCGQCQLGASGGIPSLYVLDVEASTNSCGAEIVQEGTVPTEPRVAVGPLHGTIVDVYATYHGGIVPNYSQFFVKGTLSGTNPTLEAVATQLGTGSNGRSFIPTITRSGNGEAFFAGADGALPGSHSFAFGPASDPIKRIANNTSADVVAMDADASRVLLVATVDDAGYVGMTGSNAMHCAQGACPFWGVYNAQLDILDSGMVNPMSSTTGASGGAGTLHCNSVIWAGTFKENIAIEGGTPLDTVGTSAFVARHKLL